MAFVSTAALFSALTHGAAAETAADKKDGGGIESITVTGTYIKGTSTDAALPVSVLSQFEIQKRGDPSILELIKAIPSSSGVLGDTNQFDARAQGTEGSGSVNMRGLGPQRTLVLMNGRRLATNPFGLAGDGVVDTNILPSSAIGRVEVLKDGAAATYGSDAIAGVVNFITKKNFQGLQAGGSFRAIDGSDGDYTANVTYGWVGDNSNILLSGGYQHRSELSTLKRKWANLDYLANPEGGWSAAGNPGSFVNLGTGQISRDAGCTSLGGFTGFSGATPVCFWHYANYDNIVEKEDRYQLYGELNSSLDATTKFHGEVLYAHTNVPQWKTSPSYAALAVPTAEAVPSPAFAGRFYIPANNPGLVDYVAKNPTAAGSPLLGAAGAFIVANRPFGLGGNPMFPGGASTGKREFEAVRVSGDVSGSFKNGIDWNTALTYSEETGFRSGYDTLVNRYELALRGLGGPNCNVAANTPGQNGCQWYNPFSNAIASNPITGQTNPQYNPAVANSADLARWFFKELTTRQVSRLFVADAVTNGKLGITLPGGDIAWALGAQYRRAQFQSEFNDLSNSLVTPCVNTPDFGVTNCTGSVRNGPFLFLGVGTPVNLENDVYALFGEVNLPITSKLDAQFAARYEDYRGAVGSTFNPKGTLRWQATDWLALRGSAGSSFRGPSNVTLAPSSVTSLQSILGVFRAVDIYGNPKLNPETATTYSLGAVLTAGKLHSNIDYWGYDFKDPIVAEPVAGLVNTLFPNGASAINNCGNPAFAAIQSRFTFAGACSSATIGRLLTKYINGPGIKTTGIDLNADYTFNEIYGGDLTLGGDATYILSYKVGATAVEGITVSQPFSAVGYLNYQTVSYPIPRWKGNAFVEYTLGDHNLRWQFKYVNGYIDQRTAPFSASPNYNGLVLPQGKKIDSNLTSDVTYRVFLPMDITATASILNVTDEAPSFARLDLNYDPFTGDPIGRSFKIGFQKKF
jgi:iron complex outermembrane receptor protein